MKIEQTNTESVKKLWTEVEPGIQAAKSMEEAAQQLIDGLFENYSESIVLARVFVTVPFAGLPDANKKWVEGLATSAGVLDALKPTTPVLSLVGSQGKQSEWGDRRKSQGHVGIPLISSSFVGAIPMISRLLKELGLPLDWIDTHDTEIVKRTIGKSAGLFFVEDAGQTTDSQGRKIIAAQDFVAKFGVKSVFGVGGAYFGGAILTIIVFTNKALPRSVAEQFLPVANLFKSKTTSLVPPPKVFSAS